MNQTKSKNEFCQNIIKMKKKREDLEKKVIETILLDNLKIIKKNEEEIDDEYLDAQEDEESTKKKKPVNFFEKYFPKKTKNIPIFKPQNVQNTHPGKFVNKFITQMKNKENENEDFFENLKGFVDELELNVGENKKLENDVFLTKFPENDEKASGNVNNIHNPVLHNQNLKMNSTKTNYPSHMNSYVQSLYNKYLKKQSKTHQKHQSADFNQGVSYDIIHRTKLKNMQIINQKLFRKSHIYKDNKVTRFASSLNNELGRISNNFGKIESLKFFGENPKTDYIFDNTNEYLAYKALKLREEDRKLKLLPLHPVKDPSIDKLSIGFYKLNKNIKKEFNNKKR